MSFRLASLVLVLLAFAAFAAVAAAKPVAHKSKESKAEVLGYWTEQRMRGAVPKERARGGEPREQGAKGGGGTGATSTEPSPYPSQHGKVFFTENGVNYVCSGTALTSSNQSVVWTAGHCVNEGPGAFATKFMFVPAYRDGVAPYGRFASSHLLTTSGWQTSGEFGVDVGAAVVGTNETGQTLSSAAGGRPIDFFAPRVQSYKLYGYPAAKKFNGQRMRVCSTAWSRDDFSTSPPAMGVACDMTGGSSGGGWVTSTGAVASVVSYGYSGLRNVLFGPHLESEAQQLYESAQTAAP